MKTDGLGRGPASWGRLHPFLLARLSPRPPFSFFFTFFPFWFGFAFYMSFSFSPLELYSSCSLSFYSVTETGREEPRFSPSWTCLPGLPPPPSQTPSSLRTASPYDEFCCYCLGICFGQMYKCSQRTIKNVFSGGWEGRGFFFFLGSCPSLLLLLSRLSGLCISAIIYLASEECNRAELPPQRGES